jgi:ParB family chromosome partitioning protein
MAKSLFGGRKADTSLPAAPTASFAALFDPDAEQWSLIDLDDIEVRAQSRTEFDADSLAELAQSIADIGQAVPVMVRRAEPGADKPYVLVAGERRCRALRLLGREQVRAIIRTMDESNAAAIQAAENIHRENLSQIEQARMVDAMVKKLGTAEAAAKHFGKSPGWVSQQVMLLNLPAVAQSVVDSNISADIAVIAAVASVERTAGAEAAARSVEKIKTAPKGKAREVAREAARAAKAPKAAPAAPKARKALKPIEHLREFLCDMDHAPELDEITAWISELSPDALRDITAHLQAHHGHGAQQRLAPGAEVLRGIEDARFASWGLGAAALVAWVHGVAGRPFDLADVLTTALQA